MIVSGLPERNGERHVCEIANCTLDLRDAVNTRYIIPHMPQHKLQIRIGLNSGKRSQEIKEAHIKMGEGLNTCILSLFIDDYVAKRY